MNTRRTTAALVDLIDTDPPGVAVAAGRIASKPDRRRARIAGALAPVDRTARIMVLVALALLALAGLLFVAGTRRPVRVVEHIVPVVDTAAVSGVDAVGCPAGRSCVVRSARLLAYIANARTTIALDVAGWETVDRATDVVYRRMFSEFRNEPSISVHVVFQCVPNAVLPPTASRTATTELVGGRFRARGSDAVSTGAGCSAQYWYSIDAPWTSIDPALLRLDDLINDPTLRLSR